MNDKPLITAGICMGVGLGGFVDGILFHQILQTHSMLSARLPNANLRNLEVNMFWDGLFHAMTWMATVVGLLLLWRAGRRDEVPWSGMAFIGALLAGWGLFNLVEGTIDHHLLNLHHVVERLGRSAFDYGFLAFGVLLVAIGFLVIRSARRGYEPASRRQAP